MIEWFSFTPESIPALVETLLAVIIACYLFSLKEKSFVLWLLGISLIGESLHHFVKLIAFSVPALYQSVTPLLGFTSIFIFTLLVVFTYHYHERLYRREEAIVTGVLGVVGAALAIYLVYIFVMGRSYDQLPATREMLYASLGFLLFSAAWAIVVLLRKAYQFKASSGAEDRKAVGACYAFAGIFSLKIFIILASVLSEAGVISVGFRIYTNLILHIVYLSGLTVIMIDHLKHSTLLRMKLIGLVLASVLLILSIGGLSIYSTRSLLDQTSQFLPERETLQFLPDETGSYALSVEPVAVPAATGAVLDFGDRENIQLDLEDPVVVFGKRWRRLFVNRHGLVALGSPYEMAAEPLFYLEQRSAPYHATLHWEAYKGPPFIAGLHLRTAPGSAAIRIDEQKESLIITWDMFFAAWAVDERRPTTFSVEIDADGRIAISHEAVGVYLHEGLVGVHPGAGAETSFVSPFNTSAITGTTQTFTSEGIVLDLAKQFRAYVHGEVMPLVWLILGSIVFILLIFPVALRASILRPLSYLQEGVQRIDKGDLDAQVPVVAQDEIGNVATGFNKMMASLKEAHFKLVQHADHLEQEVASRTDEIQQQKQVLEQQALRVRELDEMKSRFFANISHEFRTPLNLIMGPLQSILDGDFGALDEKLMHRHRVMLVESGRLLKLINQLLDLSKLEAGRMILAPQPTDLVALWRRIAHSFASRAEMEEKTLQFHAETSNAVGLVDEERMEQIGYNLIDNALKFTEAGGKIHVSVDLPDEAAGANGAGEQAIITVRDTGCGISRDQLIYIFDRFHQVDPENTGVGGGTGIGLALVKELVHLHGGSIEVDSEPGFGTTFNLFLPIDSTLIPVASGKFPDSAASKGNPETLNPVVELVDQEYAAVEDQAIDKEARLLVVDDDSAFREFISEYLGDKYDIVDAEDGAAGFALASQDPPDLIVSDLMMPEMDGLAFCQAVKENHELDHIPFILLTARASVENRIEGLEQGADDYLSKPVDPRELRSRIQNLLDQRSRLIEKFTDVIRLGPEEVMVESAEAVLLKKIVAAVEGRLDDSSFNVTLLAEETGMSVRDLQRKVKKLLNMGPRDLIETMRMEKARQLLAGKAGTVSQIAYKVGFSRPEYFMRIFKRHTGMTPGQFMKGEAEE